MIVLICSELLLMSSCYMTNCLTTRDWLYTLTWNLSIIQAVQLYSEKEKLRETATGTVEMEEYALDDYLKDAHRLFEEELPSGMHVHHTFKG